MNKSRFIVFFFLVHAVGLAAQSVPQELYGALKWRLIGPFRGGRAVAAAGVPGDSTTFYFGAVNGGIWKTTDAGMVWAPIFDSQPAASIGALAVAPSNPNVIYAGTGESDIRSSLSFGNGVYKSEDAGRSWQHVGLENTRHISRIVIDPQNPDVVYVGALGHVYGSNEERGIYKSSDGGSHWTKVLDQGPNIGVSDLAICAGTPQLLFAGLWHTWRPPWSTYAPVELPGSGLFRSRDGGATWSRLSGGGLPEGDWGRVGIDVAPNGKRVYALIQLINDKAKKSGLYRSDDGGDTWTLANSDPRLTSRQWYFGGVTIDPGNPDVVYLPNVALYRSEDSGKTIQIVRGAPGGDDYHQIWIDPRNSAGMVLATDQGTTVSLDRGKTWSSWYNQPTAQLYHVATDNRFPYAVYGAQQDTGSAAVLSRTDHGRITPRDWFPGGASESGYMVVDAEDPDIIYLSGAYGGVSRYNRKTGFSQDITPWPVFTWGAEINQRKYRATWSPVLVSSPTDPKTLYFGTQYVMKTADGGLHWQTISPDLTGAAPANEVSKAAPTVENSESQGFGTVYTIAPSPRDRDLIWAGSDTGLIHLTRDGGRNWSNVTPPGLSAWSKISLIEASHFDPAVAYAAVDRSRLDDMQPYLYRTRDYGATWQAITQGIAAPAFLRAVREDPQRQGLLFAGTEWGVYASFDDGNHWQSLQLNLPVTSVRDLTIHGDDLVIATHGRSLWILDDITPLRHTLEAAKAGRFLLYPVAAAVRVDSDGFSGTPLPPEEPTADNPPNGAIIDYYLGTAAKSVKLEIYDEHNLLISKYASDEQHPPKRPPLPIADRWFPKPELLETTPGMHRFVWNLVFGQGSGGSGDDEESEYRGPTGPKSPPGTYEVRLTVDGESQNRPLEVSMDPRCSASKELLAQQFELARKMYLESRALAEINSTKKQLADLQAKIAGNARLKARLSAALAEISAILNPGAIRNQGSARARQDSGKTNPGAETKVEQLLGLQEAWSELNSALRVVESGDREVPSQAMALYQDSSRYLKQCLVQWTAFQETTLPALNLELQRAGYASVQTKN